MPKLALQDAYLASTKSIKFSFLSAAFPEIADLQGGEKKSLFE